MAPRRRPAPVVHVSPDKSTLLIQAELSRPGTARWRTWHTDMLAAGRCYRCGRKRHQYAHRCNRCQKVELARWRAAQYRSNTPEVHVSVTVDPIGQSSRVHRFLQQLAACP